VIKIIITVNAEFFNTDIIGFTFISDKIALM